MVNKRRTKMNYKEQTKLAEELGLDIRKIKRTAKTPMKDILQTIKKIKDILNKDPAATILYSDLKNRALWIRAATELQRQTDECVATRSGIMLPEMERVKLYHKRRLNAPDPEGTDMIICRLSHPYGEMAKGGINKVRGAWDSFKVYGKKGIMEKMRMDYPESQYYYIPGNRNADGDIRNKWAIVFASPELFWEIKGRIESIRITDGDPDRNCFKLLYFKNQENKMPTLNDEDCEEELPLEILKKRVDEFRTLVLKEI